MIELHMGCYNNLFNNVQYYVKIWCQFDICQLLYKTCICPFVCVITLTNNTSQITQRKTKQFMFIYTSSGFHFLWKLIQVLSGSNLIIFIDPHDFICQFSSCTQNAKIKEWDRVGWRQSQSPEPNLRMVTMGSYPRRQNCIWRQKPTVWIDFITFLFTLRSTNYVSHLFCSVKFNIWIIAFQANFVLQFYNC